MASSPKLVPPEVVPTLSALGQNDFALLVQNGQFELLVTGQQTSRAARGLDLPGNVTAVLKSESGGLSAQPSVCLTKA